MLVTDAETRGSLAVARALHSAGFEITAITSGETGPAPAHWSRHVGACHKVPSPLEDRSRFLDELERIVKAHDYFALVAGSDASLFATAWGRHRLQPHLRVQLPTEATVRRSLDRLELFAAAARHDLPPPPTVLCQGSRAGADAARDLGFPLIVKPTVAVFSVGGNFRRIGAKLISQESELAPVTSMFGDSFLAQRHEAGAVISFAGVFADGRLRAEAVSRYHRTWRPEAGGACFSETIAAPRFLTDRVAALLEDLRWTGMFELELIERPNGGYGAIDFNPRPYGSLALAVRAGANLPAIWCGHHLGQRPRVARAAPGVFFRWEDAELGHALWHVRRRRVEDALRVLRLRRRVVHAHFTLRDPAPLLARLIYVTRCRLHPR